MAAQALSQLAASPTSGHTVHLEACWDAAGQAPRVPGFWVLLDTSLKPMMCCRIQHAVAPPRAQLSDVRKLQLALCYPGHLHHHFSGPKSHQVSPATL